MKLKKRVNVIHKLLHTDGDRNELDVLLGTIPPLFNSNADETKSDSEWPSSSITLASVCMSK
jgi:hypothetical protein